MSAAATDTHALEAALRCMTRTLRHRGPDDEGSEVISRPPDSAVLFTNTRLAILDLSTAGHQPMRDPATGNWVVLNGEIYNYRALRVELGREDVRREGEEGKGEGGRREAGEGNQGVETGGGWRSDSDTEVLLRAYARWGVACLDRLRGMFAFALWDQAAKRLLLVRDQFGIKPLYYTVSGCQLVFASQVRALLASGLVPRRLDSQALASYLSFGSVETPLTIVRDVRSLQPGHLLIAELHGKAVATTVRRYADLGSEQATSAAPTRAVAGRVLRGVLEESVQAHLVSDVPVGAFLSGGTDSSAIVALMRRVSAQTPRTFSVVFAEQQFSEAPYARALAARCGTEHTEIPLSEGELFGMLPAALRAMDQPTIDGLNTFVVSRAVRQAGVTVALSGLGGDELFGGYPSFARARWLSRVPTTLRRRLAGVARAAASGSPRARKAAELLTTEDPQHVYLLSRQLFGPPGVAALAECVAGAEGVTDRLPAVSSAADPFLAISLYELGHYMQNTLLRDADCMSMAHALEVRVPFVDRDVVRTVMGIASRHKVNGQRPKALLLEAVGDLLPEAVWRRPKMGFSLPFERWMQSRLRAELDAAFDDRRRFAALGLQARACRHVWQRFLRQPRQVGWSRPWALYVLAEWSALNDVTM
ncbi:MAG: asparagine synthase (glutamine-hydrolyzing) [Candidatus Binatia bacterium]